MSTDEQKRWLEISPYLDEALDLDESARAQWLKDLDDRAPTVAEAVRSLVATRAELAEQPLLKEGRTAVKRAGLALGRPQVAHERMRDGLANLAKVSDPSYDRRTECGLAQARLLWSEGRLPEAIDAATAVAGIMEAAHRTDDDLSYQSVTSMLEVMLGQEGRRREAREWNARAIAALERSGREATLSMSNARHNQATHLYNGGEVRAAFEQERALVQRLVAQQGIDSVPAPFGNRLGVYQTRIEGTDAGFAWLDRAVATADSQSNRLDQIGAYLGRAPERRCRQRTYGKCGNPTRGRRHRECTGIGAAGSRFTRRRSGRRSSGNPRRAKFRHSIANLWPVSPRNSVLTFQKRVSR